MKSSMNKAECPFCGGTNFQVLESSVSKAYTDPEKPDTIKVNTSGGDIDKIYCINHKCPGEKDGVFVDITEAILGSEVQFEFD